MGQAESEEEGKLKTSYSSKCAQAKAETTHPKEEEDPGRSRGWTLAPAFLRLIAARNFCTGRSLEKPVMLGLGTTSGPAKTPGGSRDC